MEMSAEEIIAKVVDMIENYLAVRGVGLELKPGQLAYQILSYIDLRMTTSTHDISDPPTKPWTPPKWTAHHESVWRDWIYYNCSLESWQRDVMGPVFGTDLHTWEPEGWRDEVIHYLPWWIRRSMSVVERFDPTPIDDEAEEVKLNSGLDPYLQDHGSAKQRKRANQNELY